MNTIARNDDNLEISTDPVWDGLHDAQRFLVICGLLMLLAGLFHVVVWGVDGEPLTGAVSWRKPITFGLSFGLNALSIAWLLGRLPNVQRQGWRWAAPLGVAAVATVFLVSLQQWRGVPSHFNFGSTPLNGRIAAMIVFWTIPVTIVLVGLTVRAFRVSDLPPTTSWMMRIGMILMLGGIGAGIFNAIYARMQFVQQTGLPQEIYGAAGLMKLPHGIGLHAFQVLLVLLWLLERTPWSERTRLRSLLLCSAGCTGLFGLSLAQMLRGLAPLDLEAPVMLLLVASVVLVCAPFVAAFFASRAERHEMAVGAEI